MTYYAVLASIPIAVVSAFFIHWFTLRSVTTGKARLEISRGVYLGFSFQIVIFAGLLFYLGKSVFLAPLFAVGFSILGDWFNLHFPVALKNNGEPLIGGIVSFAMAQLFYISAFFQLTPWNSVYTGVIPYVVTLVFLILPAVIFYFRVYNPKRPKPIMIFAFVYGLVLCFFVSLAVNAFIAFGGYWIFLMLGGLVFLLSDAVMGETTIHGGRHPVWEFQVPWITYLIAQSLLLIGFFLLSHTMVGH
ncbi:MAG: lysoplasmalogenase family protein [Leptospira sp.]|nr:lysoplasmalogenase family protein [Leptospira sp.]